MLGRKLWTYVRFRVELHTRLAIEIASTSVGLILIVIGDATLQTAGSVLSLISGVFFLLDLRERWRRRQRTRIVENEDYNEVLDACSYPDGYELHLGALSPGVSLLTTSLSEARPYIASADVNALLDGTATPLSFDREPYELPEHLTALRARCINLEKPDFDSAKVRLASDITPHSLLSGHAVSIQPTRYFHSFATNERACEQFEQSGRGSQGRPRLMFAMSDMIVVGRSLVGLSESVLSNHIGVSTIVITGDDHVVLQQQGEQAVCANETAIGASGSLDLADARRALDGDATLQNMLRLGMEREAAEELSASFPVPGTHTVLTGYARFLSRGGKPEFFGISRTPTYAGRLRPGRNEERYVAGISATAFDGSDSDLLRVLDELLIAGRERRRKYSLSMVVSLRLAKQFLERRIATSSAPLLADGVSADAS